MRRISVNRYFQFSALLIAIVFIAVSIFYFAEERLKKADFLMDLLRRELVEASHMLSTRLDSTDNIQIFESVLARTAANNDFIDAFMVTDEQKVLLTTDNRYRDIPSSNQICSDLRGIDPMILLQKTYYKQRITFFENDLKRSVYLYLIVDADEVKSYINSTMTDAVSVFVVLSVLVTLILFMVHRRYLIQPLELLRQFAYYQSKIPGSFPVLELEYIRASLLQTFARLEQEKKDLYDLARTDQLSGLLNRNALFERTNWLIAEASRENSEFAVLFLDLDHFKDVNDSLGHQIGDELLKNLAGDLQKVIRTEDFIARIGGDEFVVIINNYESHMELTRVIQRLLDRIKQPFVIETHPVEVSASIGVVLYPKDGTDMQILLKHADIAMYEAKRKGRDQYHFFTLSLNEKVQEDIKLEKDLRTALANGEFKLYYQPKVDVQTGLIVGAEALIRWFHPKDGLIPPNRFIPLCENTGFIVPLGEWVLLEAARQQVQWREAGIMDLPISINMSVKQLHDEHFAAKFKSILDTTSIQPQRLDIEITEYMFLENSERNVSVLKSLRDQGITVSLDDFGTGYSSLSYLKKFPMDTLKIDKSFIDDYESATGSMFIETIVNIGKTLEMAVVAEGVETLRQVEFLQQIGCDMYQGYYCSRPLDADSYARFVQGFGKEG